MSELSVEEKDALGVKVYFSIQSGRLVEVVKYESEDHAELFRRWYGDRFRGCFTG